ncbi:MAG TPA: hypothetical protein VGH33_23270, partial [Isosphaeraceae bacterium]
HESQAANLVKSVDNRTLTIDLTRVIRDCQGQGLAQGYVRVIVISVHAMLNWAARAVHDRGPGGPERVLPEKPFRGVERPGVPAPARRYIGIGARRAFYAYACSVPSPARPIPRPGDTIGCSSP